MRLLAMLWCLTLGFTTNSAFASAPLCSSVLSSAAGLQATPAQIEEAFSNLAQMKMELDISQASGELTTSRKIVLNQFSTKLDELSLALLKPKSEVREMVAERIQELQSKEADAAVIEKEHKASIQVNFVPLFERQQRIEVPFATERDSFEYLPEENLIFFKDISKTALEEFNLVTQEHRIISEEEVNFQLTPDRSKLAIATKKGLLRFYDVRSKSMSRNVHFGKGIVEARSGIFIKDIKFDPTGEILAGISPRGVIVYNMKARKTLSFFLDAREIYPLSASEVIIQPVLAQGSPYILEVDTGNKRKIGNSPKDMILKVASDGSEFVVLNATSGSLKFFDPKKPSRPTLVISAKDHNNEVVHDLTKVPATNYYFSKRRLGRKATLALHAREDFSSPALSFDSYEQSSTFDFRLVRFSPDGKTMILSIDEGRGHYLDIWSVRTEP